MKRMKISKWSVAALAAVAAVALPVAIVAWQGPGQVYAAPRFTPIQLADGLAFNQGPAATYLALFGRPKVAVTEKLLAAERSVDATLRANPSLARKFASDAQSGNSARVAAALRLLGRLTRAAFTAEFGRASSRHLTAWARQWPERVNITTAAYASPGVPGCVVNTPPATVTGPPTPPPYYSYSPLPLVCPCSVYQVTPAPSAPPASPPPSCSTCVINTPPPTVTYTPSPCSKPTTMADVSAIPSGVALSLPYLLTGSHLATRADRKDTAETIAVVAFSLDAD